MYILVGILLLLSKKTNTIIIIVDPKLINISNENKNHPKRIRTHELKPSKYGVDIVTLNLK